MCLISPTYELHSSLKVYQEAPAPRTYRYKYTNNRYVIFSNSIFLFVDQFPKHQSSISAADGDDILVIVEESGAGNQWTIHFLLDILGLGIGAWIFEEPKITLGIAAYQHVVCRWSAGGGDNCGQWIITIVPLSCEHNHKKLVWM